MIVQAPSSLVGAPQNSAKLSALSLISGSSQDYPTTNSGVASVKISVKMLLIHSGGLVQLMIGQQLNITLTATSTYNWQYGTPTFANNKTYLVKILCN